MSRHRGSMSDTVFDRTWPFYVPIRGDIARANPGIAQEAALLGVAPENRSLLINDKWHICYCFGTLEAAETFAKRHGAEIKDARKRINKALWQIWEEKPAK
jgi:hypothetical protein